MDRPSTPEDGFGRWRPEPSGTTTIEALVLAHRGQSRTAATTPSATTGRTYRSADQFQTRATMERSRRRTVGALTGGTLARPQTVTPRPVERSVRVPEQAITEDGCSRRRSFAGRDFASHLKLVQASLADFVDTGSGSSRHGIPRSHAHAGRAAAVRPEGEHHHFVVTRAMAIRIVFLAVTERH